MANARNLNEWVKDHRANAPGPLPWITTLPEWDEVLAGWQAGITQTQIRRWLIDERGYPAHDVTIGRLAHLSKYHPRTSRSRDQ